MYETKSSVFSAHDSSLRFLLIRYQLPDVFRFRRRYQRRMAQPSLALLALARQQVTFESPASFNLAAAGYFESFHRRAVALDLGHIILLCPIFVFALCLTLA